MSVTTFFIRAVKGEAEGVSKRPLNYRARLLTATFLFPVAAMLFTIVFFIAAPNWQLWALPFGLAAAACLCLAAAFLCKFVEPEYGIPTSYAELQQRLRRLQALAASLSIDEELQNAAAYLEATMQLEEIGQALEKSGMQWVWGHGYTDAWARFHRAEEALIELIPLDDVFAEAEIDELRLIDSEVPNRDTLKEKVRKAMDVVRAAAVGKDLESLPFALATIRTVRRSINEYRDKLWTGLIVARNRVYETCALTAVAFFAVVATAIANKATSDQMIAAAFFCAIGAAVGLAKRLRDDLRAGSAAVDEGLSAARLITIPLFSGFAAVCGVALTALLPTADPAFAAVFNAGNAKNFLVAAAFGLAPDLLFDTLQSRAETIKKQLTSSQPAGKS